MTATRQWVHDRHPDCAEEMIAFGARVRELRGQRGLSQEALATAAAHAANGAAAHCDRRLTFDRQSVNRVENAAYTPGLHRLFQLARALGVHPAELVGGRPPQHLSPDNDAAGGTP